MANPIHLWLKNEAGVDLKGSSTVQGREGSIEVIAHDHCVEIPTDDNTGKLTGPRVHAPFEFVKELDAASVYLMGAVTDSKTLQSAEFKFYRPDTAGNETVCYTVLLKNVKVVKVSPKMHDMKDPSLAKYSYLEQISLRYEEITWTYPEGNLVQNDTWEKRGTA